MPEDYYSDGASSPSDSAAPDDSGGDDANDTSKTAVVPAELCPGMKVGDKMVVKIVGVDDDSYEIAYEPGSEKEESAEQSSAPAPEGSMASMME